MTCPGGADGGGGDGADGGGFGDGAMGGRGGWIGSSGGGGGGCGGEGGGEGGAGDVGGTGGGIGGAGGGHVTACEPIVDTALVGESTFHSELLVLVPADMLHSPQLPCVTVDFLDNLWSTVA